MMFQATLSSPLANPNFLFFIPKSASTQPFISGR
jgi:hypothetical protein